MSLLKRQQALRKADPRHSNGCTTPKACTTPQLQAQQPDWDELLPAWPLGASAQGAQPMEMAPAAAGADDVATSQLVEEILAEMFATEVGGAAEQAPALSGTSSCSSDCELEAMIEDELRAAALAATLPCGGCAALVPQAGAPAAAMLAAAPAPSTADPLQLDWAAATGPKRIERLQGLLGQYQQLQATIEQLRMHVQQLCTAVPLC